MFKVTFPNLNYMFDTQNDTQNDIETMMIYLIKNNPKITRKEIAEYTGKSKPTIARILKNSNKIKHVGSSKGGHWEINE